MSTCAPQIMCQGQRTSFGSCFSPVVSFEAESLLFLFCCGLYITVFSKHPGAYPLSVFHFAVEMLGLQMHAAVS